ncbi:MAG: anthranilate synthase component I family protein [Paenibacillus sp.]|uniref:anthranilate synthase component I family protein n=1 Tax=Paenibacillus sp. TaxID=58172 RepID=UPI00290AB669|nr:anthranilate synthase component I family protein [Paenibacillus sp.]MDU4695688.1 anthranilate synthase component I family protein [Paenibacillus sp.]
MEKMTSWEQWRDWAQTGSWTMLPFAVKCPLTASGLPADWSQAWEEAGPYACVLESGKGGRYTFLGLEPVSVIRGKGNEAVVHDLTASGQALVRSGKPLELLRDWMAPYRSPAVPGLPKFSGGAVGYLAYDVARSLERLPNRAQDDLGLDDYVWMRLEELWAIDQAQGDVYCVVHVPIASPDLEKLRESYRRAEVRAVRMARRWKDFYAATVGAESAAAPGGLATAPSSISDAELKRRRLAVSMTQEAFEAAVRRVQEYIAAGDVFQVNLSLRQAFALTARPELVYEQLRRLNPSPYMGLLRFPDFQLVSASPELLVKVEQGKLSTRPIAGTRRRGHTPEEDRQMEEELRGNEKEQAEHIMLVDLLRNDIGRVAEYGTVRVSELFTVERYSHVMHLVSEVEGELGTEPTIYDAIAAVFPGGTITGAPKVRTMEIIQELEPVTRGPYTGAMGWIDYAGNMELNIIIRTLVAKDGVGYLQTGAGIVIDSDPYREYRECFNKARAVALAIQQAEKSQLDKV